jgi:hypothetical protein
MRNQQDDPNAVWIVRDSTGRIVGASAIDQYLAADEVAGRNGIALLDSIDNTLGPTYTAKGYTLTREALANHPEMPESLTRVTDEMVERAAKATVARVVAEAFELYADEEEAMRVHREYARIALTAALEGPRDQ